MLTVTVNGQKCQVAEGSTVLDAAVQCGVFIPTLCFYRDYKPFTSCMVCVVEHVNAGTLMPACCAPVTDEMIIETDNERVREARKVALELLLSDHLGDCEAPCTTVCPAHMNIPLMIRQIAAGHFDEAAATVLERIPLPGVLGYICPAPCEKACRRGKHDDPVAICLLKRFAGEYRIRSGSGILAPSTARKNKNVAIIGSGPAGLSAAYYLQCSGYDCMIYDDRKESGGMLRYGISEDNLPRSVLDGEIERIRKLGVQFVQNTAVGNDISLRELHDSCDAVVIASGHDNLEYVTRLGVSLNEHGVSVDAATCSTGVDGVFACGNAVRQRKMAVHAVAAGQTVAVSVDQYLSSREITGSVKEFNCSIGRLQEGEIDTFMKEADDSGRIAAADTNTGSYTADEAQKEAARCLHCDCRKARDCKLREFATVYGAQQNRFKGSERRQFTQVRQHAKVIYEPGKCIKCGICVRITEARKEALGLAFIGRGFDVEVSVPFSQPLERGLIETAEDCVRSCPTGALAFKDNIAN
jgi:NADPH-dependent glutamate synthase beta subunit-like oxidoreductase